MPGHEKGGDPLDKVIEAAKDLGPAIPVDPKELLNGGLSKAIEVLRQGARNARGEEET